MKKLTILYDADCPMCQRCREFLQQEPTWLELEFIPLQDPVIDRRYPGIREFHPEKEIVVITDEGGIYQGGPAWITILYALKEYREWSYRLASPALLPYAKKVVSAISTNRKFLSQFFANPHPGPEIVARFKDPETQCDIKGTRCGCE